MKLSRRDFLRAGVIGVGGAFLKKMEPPNDPVVLPIISNEYHQDFVKLVERSVPDPAGIAPGFVFSDIGNFRKLILNCSARMSGTAQWMPVMKVNNSTGKIYEQRAEIYIAGNVVWDFGKQYKITMPGTLYRTDPLYPYGFEAEFDNASGLYKRYRIKGIFPMGSDDLLSQFEIWGVAYTPDQITRIDLYLEFANSFFGPHTVVSLYGVT